ncbi:MAG: SAM-dependent methyltransferase, partial [Chloroflexota bacterium]
MLYYLALFLLSAATLLLELALLRLFAVQQFYHFAFMAISLALLGAGASGSILSLQASQRTALDRPLSAAWICLGFGASTVVAFLIINYLPFDSFSIAWDGRQVFFLALYFLAAATPFIFAGLVVGRELMLAGEAGGSHRVYSANLLGSAAGSLGSLPVLAALG